MERINITVSPGILALINDLADQHYGGNRSQFIRTASIDHGRSLNGDSSLTLDLMRSELARQSELLDSLDSRFEVFTELAESDKSPAQPLSQLGNPDEVTDKDAGRIIDLLKSSQSGLTPADICDAIGLRLTRVSKAIERLDREDMIVEVSENGVERCKLATA